jgi:integrase
MGTIRKRGETFQADWTVNGERKRKTFKLHREAKEFLSRVDVGVADGTYVDPGLFKKNTLQMLIDRYVETFGRTQRGFDNSKTHHIKKIAAFIGGDTLLVSIRKNHLQDFRNHLENTDSRHGRPFTVASINRVLSCFSHMMNCAVEWEMIPQAPFRKASKILRKPENNRIDRFLSAEEISRLVDACDGYLKDLVICAINSGLRFSEIINLQWSQVRGGFIYLTHTKSDKPRQIPLNTELETLFKQIRQREGLRSDFVFTRKGRPIGNNMAAAFKKVCERAGLKFGRQGGGVTFHILRHTFASHVAMKTGSLKLVKDLLGHSELSTTERYAHLTEKAYKDAVDALNGLTSHPAHASQFGTNVVI